MGQAAPLAGGFLAAIFPLTFRQVRVSDAWRHVTLGKWLVKERSMSNLSHFCFSPRAAGTLGSELRWGWKGDVTLYFCHMPLGSLGLQILVVECVLLASFFLIKSGGDRVGSWTLLLQAGDCAAARAVDSGWSSSGIHIQFRAYYFTVYLFFLT